MQEKRKVPFIGDKHKTSRLEGFTLTFWTDWLMTSSRWRSKLDNTKNVSDSMLTYRKEGEEAH
jgi:hypothetical protein